MKKLLISLSVIVLGSSFFASPVQFNVPPSLHRTIAEKLANASMVVSHLNEIASVLTLGDELVTGKQHNNFKMVREAELKARQLQKLIQQALQLNNQLASSPNKMHLTLLLIKKVEELLLHIRKAYGVSYEDLFNRIMNNIRSLESQT